MTLQGILRLKVLPTDIAKVTFLRGKVLRLEMILSHSSVLAKFSTDQTDKTASRGAALEVLLSKLIKRGTWGRGRDGERPAPIIEAHSHFQQSNFKKDIAKPHLCLLRLPPSCCRRIHSLRRTHCSLRIHSRRIHPAHTVVVLPHCTALVAAAGFQPLDLAGALVPLSP